MNERRNIVVVDGRAQEFLVDYYWNEPVSVLKKIAFFKAAATGIRDLSVLDIRSVENVFFSTVERLRTMPFCEAIFQFDGLGSLFHFSDEVYDKPVFEQKMRI